MLNGQLVKFMRNWQHFRWLDGARIELGRLATEGAKGVDLLAKLIVHDWMPDVRQRPSQVSAILVDTVSDALRAAGRAECERIAGAMMAQLEEV